MENLFDISEEISLVSLTSDELVNVEGGKAEWLLWGWAGGLGIGLLCTGIYVGYND
ncbi:class IIb bacteriocin, lactobin A/cerein 7B family [Flavobacterium sp. MMS24-S5]|uniref:class IIb bacteriocin, lactobin A/cerein 7B family n=1 Tax=Flavobacterium sp. MMS24-S5 TaxID=3416605 RepID=UPI003CFCEDD7